MEQGRAALGETLTAVGQLAAACKRQAMIDGRIINTIATVRGRMSAGGPRRGPPVPAGGRRAVIRLRPPALRSANPARRLSPAGRHSSPSLGLLSGRFRLSSGGKLGPSSAARVALRPHARSLKLRPHLGGGRRAKRRKEGAKRARKGRQGPLGAPAKGRHLGHSSRPRLADSCVAARQSCARGS